MLSVETHEAVEVKRFCDSSGGGRRRLIHILSTRAFYYGQEVAAAGDS